MKSFNVIIATNGRPTLQRMVDSIAPQLTKDDFLTFLWDCQAIPLQINSECKVINIQNPEPLGFWGHGSRNKWQSFLPGDYHMNADDDDYYMPNAMEIVREHCTEDHLYVFKMQVGDRIIPRIPVLEMSNIGTPCGVYKPHSLQTWRHEYGGDFHFYNDLSKTRPVQFIDKIIYQVIK